jgi:hypothetical protein
MSETPRESEYDRLKAQKDAIVQREEEKVIGKWKLKRAGGYDPENPQPDMTLSSPPPVPSPATTPATDFSKPDWVVPCGECGVWGIVNGVQTPHHNSQCSKRGTLPVAPSAPPASDAPPATWRELAEAVFPNSHAMSKADRAAFDASAWPDVEPVEIEPGPASDAPAPPRNPSTRSDSGIQAHSETLEAPLAVSGPVAEVVSPEDQGVGDRVDLDSVCDPTFCGGLSPVEYLDRLHDGTLGERDEHGNFQRTLAASPAQEATPPRVFCNALVNDGRHVCRFRKGHDGEHHPHCNAESIFPPAREADSAAAGNALRRLGQVTGDYERVNVVRRYIAALERPRAAPTPEASAPEPWEFADLARQTASDLRAHFAKFPNGLGDRPTIRLPAAHWKLIILALERAATVAALTAERVQEQQQKAGGKTTNPLPTVAGSTASTTDDGMPR